MAGEPGNLTYSAKATACEDSRHGAVHASVEYRSLIENLPHVVMRFDREFRHLFTSPGVEQVTGIPAEAFLGKTHREMGFPEDKCRFWEERIREVFESGEPIETEFAFDSNGREIYFDWRLLPEGDESGQVDSVLTIARDVTRHRQIERDYAMLFEQMLDGFALHEIICDDSGRPIDYRFLRVNPAFEKMTGLKAKEIVGKTVHEVLPDIEPFWIATYGGVALTGIPARIENYSRQLDKYYEVVVFCPRSGQFACLIEDVTARKRTEKQLHDSHELASSIIDSIPSGLFIYQYDPPGTLRLIGANPAARRLTGIAFEDAFGKEFDELWPNARALGQHFLDALRTGESYRTHELAYSDDRLTGVFDIHAFRLPGDRLAVAFEDITERKRIQDQLVASEGRLRETLETVPVASVMLEGEGTVVFCNRCLLELTGWTREEVIGCNWFDKFIPERNREDLRRMFNDALNSNAFPPAYENPILTKSGEELLIGWRNTHYRDTDGRIHGVSAFGLDITEMRRQEQALRDSERTARALLDASVAAVCLLDRDGAVLDANLVCTQRFGCTRSELIGQTVWDLFPPDVAEERKKLTASVFETGQPARAEDCRDGMWNHSVLYPVFDDAGTVRSIAVHAVDISARKAMEERLRLETEVLAILNQAVSDSNTIRRILELIQSMGDFNAVGIRLREGDDYPYFEVNGFSPAFVEAECSLCIYESDSTLVRDEEGAPLLACLCGCVISGRTPSGNNCFTPKGSFWTNNASQTAAELRSVNVPGIRGRCPSAGYASVALIPLRSEGEIIGLLQVNDRRPGRFTEDMIAFLEDLGASIGVAMWRIRAETALRESKQLFDFAMDATNDGLWDWHVPSGQTYFSPAYYRMLGYEPGEFGATFDAWKELLHPEDAQRTAAVVEEHLKAGSPGFEVEFRFRTKSGGWRWILGRGKVVERDADGKPIRMVGTHVDITDRKRHETETLRLEAQLRQSQKMEAIGTLAGGIAHDFNNILSAVIGYADLAREDARDNAAVKESIGEVMQAAYRAKELVSQILTFSRQKEQEFRPLRLQTVVKEAAKLLRGSIPATIDLRLDIEEGCPAILADAGQMHQVLMNLCTNAYHAMREFADAPYQAQRPCVLEITLRKVDLPPTVTAQLLPLRPGPHVELIVRDSGKGMPQEVLDRVFEPYFTTKAKGEGTGLGLATVQGIVQTHGGVITAESQPGTGSAFCVLLPVHRGAGSAALSEPARSDADVSGTERVLIVDDEPAITKAGRIALTRLGYRVTACTSPTEAVEIFARDPAAFDVVITDLTMPKMTGIELAQQIHARRPDLPILLCTGYSDRVEHNARIENLFVDLVQKPVIVRELAMHVREALEKSAP